MSTDNLSAADRGSEFSTSPTDAEDRAFWAFLIVANVWSASDTTGWLRLALVMLWIAFAVAVRWPYWCRT